jgi:predicted nucleotidyltransferase
VLADVSSALPTLRSVAGVQPGLKLLVVHGSRARGDTHAGSDWDFAYLATPDFDPSLLYADLAIALGTDHVDLVDLASSGGLIRYHAARDAVVVHESEPGLFDKFWFAAVSFWCDAEPVLRRGYASILAELKS